MDTGFTGGSIRSVAATAPISAGEDPDVYRTARHGASFSYALPVASGSYRVKLKFAELDHFGAGLRRFSVAAEGQVKVAHLDLFATAGNGVGYDVEFTAAVADGTLDLVFTSSIGTATVAAIVVRDAAPATASHSLIAPGVVPSGAFADGVPYELGVTFRTTAAGEICAIRYYRPSQETGTHIGRLWRNDGTKLAEVTFTGETTSGWQEVPLSPPVPVEVNVLYTVTVNCNTYYVVTSQGYAQDRVRGPLVAPGGGVNGRFTTVLGSRPTQVWANSDYYRDAVFIVPTPPAVTELDSWRNAHFTAVDLADPSREATVWGHNADPNGDGVSNFLAYALDRSPWAAQPPPPSLTSAGPPLSLSFKRARPDLRYEVLASDNLSSWAVIADDPGTVGQTVTVTDNVSIAPRFLRLRVSARP